MKLYYSPLACSLADHIALLESGMPFERESVDLKSKRTASGADFNDVTRKGYVPVLVLDSGEILTENIAILDWLAKEYPALGVPGALGRTRVLETLAFISTEVHRSFKAMWHSGTEAEKAAARTTISRLLDYLAGNLRGDYLFGTTPSMADFYLFVMLLWAERFDVRVAGPLIALRQRMANRPAVRAAMRHEGLIREVERT
jgi:glutathione S-transferase